MKEYQRLEQGGASVFLLCAIFCLFVNWPILGISISHSGTGIPKDKLQKIFDPFYTTKGIKLGTGQGPSIG